MWNKIVFMVARYWFFLSCQLRIWVTWSKIHRFLFDQAPIRNDVQLPTFACVEDILPFLRGFVWRPDSFIDLGDAMCSAEMVWYRYLFEDTHKVGDCDEFAVFLASVIQKSIDENVWKSTITDPCIMTVMWQEPDGSVSGHNVCMLKSGTIDWFIGYMDYDLPRWCGSKQNTADAVLKRYAPEAKMIGWSIHTPTLAKLEVHVF